MKNKPLKKIILTSAYTALAALATSVYAELTIQPTTNQPINDYYSISPITTSNNIPAQQPIQTTPQIQKQPPFTVEIQVDGNSEKEREQVLTEALSKVLTKNSDDPKIITLPLIKAALSNPGIYVQRYTYVNRNIVDDLQALFLQIQFNQEAITQLLKQPVQTKQIQAADKQQILVWLAKVVFGNKTLEDESSNDVIVPILKKNAQDFGVPIILPISDLQDASRIKADDICNLNTAAIKNASERYGTTSIIAGCMKQAVTGSIWSGQWLLLHNNQSYRFNFTGTTSEDVIKQAMRTISQNITPATKAHTNQQEKLLLRITDVKDINECNEVIQYLTTFSVVSQVDLVKISSNEVELSINTTDQQTLLNSLKEQNKLVRNDTATLSPNITLDYKWVTPNNEQPQAISIKPMP